MDQQNLEKCRKFLPGLTEECPDIFAKLAQILEEKVLEIWEGENGDYYAAYLMNDSAESFLVFSNAHMIGEFQWGLEAVTQAALAVEKDSYVLAVQQGGKNSFTIRFKELKFETHLYQYHGIAHVWVRGQEHWRQLVYRLGIVKDKYQFLGEETCTGEEKELLPLLEFAPFRSWISVPWDEGKRFQSSGAGIEAFLNIVNEAGDTKYEKVLRRYMTSMDSHKGLRLENKLHDMLNLPEHIKIYDIIREKINRASAVYKKRSFGTAVDNLISEKRRAVEEMFWKNGFGGQYPWFKKHNDQMEISCYMLEEQPFVRAGRKKYRFYYFWSETDDTGKRGEPHYINEGFFAGKGRRCRIQAEEMSWEENGGSDQQPPQEVRG